MSPRRASISQSLSLFLVPRLAAWWIRITRALTRVRFVDRHVVQELERSGAPYILAFWHGRLFLMPYAYPGGRISILISEHHDGELISRTMNRFGFHTSRGSSTRGGALGLREILRKIAGGFDAAFTPDGPRGPREEVQMGVIAAARLSGAPILPVAFSCTKKNSSRRGIGSWFPCRSDRAGSSMGPPSAWRVTPLPRSSRRPAGTWSRS